jgi:hypothetical protein
MVTVSPYLNPHVSAESWRMKTTKLPYFILTIPVAFPALIYTRFTRSENVTFRRYDWNLPWSTYFVSRLSSEIKTVWAQFLFHFDLRPPSFLFVRESSKSGGLHIAQVRTPLRVKPRIIAVELWKVAVCSIPAAPNHPVLSVGWSANYRSSADVRDA